MATDPITTENELDRLIETGSELYEYIRAQNERMHPDKICLYVDSTVRRDVLTSQRQGYIILRGLVRRIVFEDKKDGVWKAFISPVT